MTADYTANGASWYTHGNDINFTFQLSNKQSIDKFEIEDVIHNPPLTIINWRNGDKTIVKCGDTDLYDPEKGVLYAIAKRAIGVTKILEAFDMAHYSGNLKQLPQDDDIIPF